MCRKPMHESFRALSRSGLTRLVLVLLALLFAFAFEAAAEKTAGSAAADGQADAQRENIPAYVRALPKGYSLEGPLTVLAATPDAISFFTGMKDKPLILVLKGSLVSVKDAENNALPFSALIQGGRVFVSRSPDKKVIMLFVMPSTGEENRNDS
jgi:hypothetical protein